MDMPTVMLSKDRLTVVAYGSCTLPGYSLHERISPRNGVQIRYKCGGYGLQSPQRMR